MRADGGISPILISAARCGGDDDGRNELAMVNHAQMTGSCRNSSRARGIHMHITGLARFVRKTPG